MKLYRILLPMAAILSLAGCLSGVLPKATIQAQYALPDATTLQAAKKLPLALQIDAPRAVSPLNGVDVVVIRADGEVQIIADARWAAPLPLLMQDLLARSIEAAGVTPSVAQSTQMHRIPLRLSGELRAFQLHDDGSARSARAALNLRLICTRDARVLASNAAIKAETADVAAGTAAAVASLRDLSTQLSQQTVQWLQQVDVSSCVDDPL